MIQPLWPAFDLDNRATMVFDLNTRVENDHRREFRLLWEELGGVELEVGSGEKRILGPGSILLAEDTTGRGHKSRAVNNEPRQCLFIALE